MKVPVAAVWTVFVVFTGLELLSVWGGWREVGRVASAIAATLTFAGALTALAWLDRKTKP
jgi:hypothetical protein